MTRRGCNCCACAYFDLYPTEQSDERSAGQLALLTETPEIVTYDGIEGVSEYFELDPSAELESTVPMRDQWVGIEVLSATGGDEILTADNEFEVEVFTIVGASEVLIATYRWEKITPEVDPNSDYDDPVNLIYQQTLTRYIESEETDSPTITAKCWRQFPNHYINLFDDTTQVNYSTDIDDPIQAFPGNSSMTYLRSLTRKRPELTGGYYYTSPVLYVRLTNLSSTEPLRLRRFRAYKLDLPEESERCGGFDKANDPYIRNAPLAITSEIGVDDPDGLAYLAGPKPVSMVFHPDNDDFPSEPNTSTTTTKTWGNPPGEPSNAYGKRTEVVVDVPTYGDLVYTFKMGHKVEIIPLYRLGGRVVCEVNWTLAYYTSSQDEWTVAESGPVDSTTVTWGAVEYLYYDAGVICPACPAGYYNAGSFTYYGPSLPTISDAGPTVTYPGGVSSNPAYSVDKWIRPGQTEYYPPGWVDSGHLSKREPVRTWTISLPEWDPGEFLEFTLDTTAEVDDEIDGVIYLAVPDVTTADPFVSQSTNQRDVYPHTLTMVRATAWPASVIIRHGGSFFDESL